MNESEYRYQLEQGLVIIGQQDNGYSVYAHLEEVLAYIEAEIGSLASRYLLCEGQDGYWDLVVPNMQGNAQIYPLNALSLDDAKMKLGHLLIHCPSARNSHLT